MGARVLNRPARAGRLAIRRGGAGSVRDAAGGEGDAEPTLAFRSLRVGDIAFDLAQNSVSFVRSIPRDRRGKRDRRGQRDSG